MSKPARTSDIPHIGSRTPCATCMPVGANVIGQLKYATTKFNLIANFRECADKIGSLDMNLSENNLYDKQARTK